MTATSIIIAALAAASAAFAALFFRGRGESARHESRAEALSKEASDLRCQIARMEGRDGEYMAPLTRESIEAFLRREIAPKVEIFDDGLVTFRTDENYVFDCSRLPQQLILRMGYSVAEGSIHWDVAWKASLAVSDRLVMVKMHVDPEDSSYDFMIVSTDRTVGSLRQNFPGYMSIIADAEKLFGEQYKEILARDYPEDLEQLEENVPQMDQKAARQALIESVQPNGIKS